MKDEYDLIGRRNDLEKLQSLCDSQAFVTIVGTPGIGKTSLARCLTFDCFSDVATIKTPADAIARIAADLGLRVDLESTEDEIESAVLRALSKIDRLIIDNAEDVVEALGETLIRFSQQTSIVITSQVPTYASTETRFELCGLIPDDEEDPAIALFAKTAKSVGIEIDATDPVLRNIVDVVGRIPLGIELAAKRTNLFSLEDILHHSQDPTFLAGNTAGRHDSLTAAIAYAISRLSTTERQFLGVLSMFDGPISSRTATTLESRFLGTKFEAIQTLRDRSLITHDNRGVRVLPVVARLIHATSVEEIDLRPLAPVLRNWANGVTVRGAHAEEIRRIAPTLRILLSLESSPDLQSAALEAAFVAARLGVPTSERLETFLKDEPTFRTAWFYVGLNQSLSGRSSDAIESFEHAKTLASAASDDVLVARADLQKFRARRIAGETVLDEFDSTNFSALVDTDFADYPAGIRCTLLPDSEIRNQVHELERVDRLLAVGEHRRLWLNVRNNYAEAIGGERGVDLLHESLAIVDEIDPLYAPIVRTFLGNVYFENGNLLEARNEFVKTYESTLDLGIRRHYCVSMLNAVWTDMILGDSDALADHIVRLKQAVATEPDVRLQSVANKDLSYIRLALDVASGAELPSNDETALSEFFRGRSPWNDDDTRLLSDPGDRRTFASVAFQREEYLAAAYPAITSMTELETVEFVAEYELILSDSPEALVVIHAPFAMRTPEGIWDHFQSDTTPFRLIRAVAEQPDITAVELVSVLWPDEVMTDSSAVNRLNVTLASARKFGLKPYLVKTDSGYMFDCQVRTRPQVR